MEYLLAASFMAAPGGLLMAKLMEPETDTPAEPEQGEQLASEKYINFIDAAATGAMNGLQMVGAIGAMLLAFIALIAMVNGILGAGGAWLGIEQLTLEGMLGGLLQPLAWTLGIPWEEARLAGLLLREAGITRIERVYTSYLKRAIKTAWLMLDELELGWTPLTYTWRLNERHYGALQGMSKAAAEREMGKELLTKYRRGYDMEPMPMDDSHPYVS